MNASSRSPASPLGAGPLDGTGWIELLRSAGLEPFQLRLPAGWPRGAGGDSDIIEPLLDRISQREVPRVRAALVAHACGLSRRFEVEAVMSRGDDRWLRIRGALRRPADGETMIADGFTEDITEREHERLDLAAEARRIDALCEALPDGVLVLQGGAILRSNHAARALLELEPRQELTALLLLERVPTEDQARVAHCLAGTGSPEASTCEVRLQNPSGRRRQVSLTVRPWMWDRQPLMICVLRDITEQSEVRRLASRQDRMASLGVLAAGVAHEINNPLAFLSMNIETIQSLIQDAPRATASASKEEILSSLEDAMLGLRRVQEIVRDLAVFSHEGSSSDGLMDPGEAVQVAVQLARLQVKHAASLEYTATRLPPVRGQVGRLSQVVLNLLVNAAKALEGAGHPGLIAVRTRVFDGQVEIAVEDNGPGVPREILDRIFEPFFTTRDPGDGMGMGLAICHGFVERMGGTLTAENRAEGGARFVIRMPVAPVEAPAPSPRESRAPAELSIPARTQPLVLIIDDEQALRRSVRRCLHPEMRVMEAANGEDGINLLNTGISPDVILCDVMMPGVDGPGICAWLERHRPDLVERVLYLTGGAVTPRARGFLSQIQDRLVEKPFGMSELRDRIVGILAHITTAQAERRRATRHPARHIGGLLDTGGTISRVRLVDMSATGLRVQGELSQVNLQDRELRLILENDQTNELVTVPVRFVRLAPVGQGKADFCFELSSAPPSPYACWVS